MYSTPKSYISLERSLDKKSKYANFRFMSRDYTDILRVISPSTDNFYLPLFLKKSSAYYLYNEHEYYILYLN